MASLCALLLLIKKIRQKSPAALHRKKKIIYSNILNKYYIPRLTTVTNTEILLSLSEPSVFIVLCTYIYTCYYNYSN